MTIPIDQGEFKRQVAIYQAATDQIQFVDDNKIDLSYRHYDALINASAYILSVDRQLRGHGLDEEFVWGDGDYNEICSHSMIYNILRNMRCSIGEADQLENIKYALQKRDMRIRLIWNTMSNNYSIVTPQYYAEVHKLVVQQALEIVNYDHPSPTFAKLAGFTDPITLSDDRLIEFASDIAKAASDKEELDSLRDWKLDSSEEDADYLAAEMGEEPTVSTKKDSKKRRINKKVKRYP